MLAGVRLEATGDRLHLAATDLDLRLDRDGARLEGTHYVGLGADLLQDALIRAIAGARHYGARAVVVDAIDDRAAAFYRHHGFLPLEGNRLYRRVADIEHALRS